MTLTHTETEQDTFTVEDMAGLDALPAGARLHELDMDCELVKLDDGRYSCCGGLCGFEAAMVSLPAVLLNPEILGDLLARQTFVTGDAVTITGTFGANQLWVGRQGVVIEDTGLGHSTYIKLTDGDRPDGYALESFYWPTEFLALVPEPVVEENAKILTVETLDALPQGTVVVAANDDRRPYIKLNGDEWLRPNVFASSQSIAERDENSAMLVSGAVFYRERINLIALIESDELLVKHLPASTF